MNFEKIAEYADLIERNTIGLKFDMANWIHANGALHETIWGAGGGRPVGMTDVVPMAEEYKCGTAACIAGHVAVNVKRGFPISFRDSYEIAAEELGLTFGEASVLFTPTSRYCAAGPIDGQVVPSYSKITRATAVAALRNIVKNKSIVDCWPVEWNVNYFRYDEEEST